MELHTKLSSMLQLIQQRAQNVILMAGVVEFAVLAVHILEIVDEVK